MVKLQAHRGSASRYPENTMAAFRAAVDEGYAYIELDPKFTSDGHFVILHDRTLKRTCRAADGSEADTAIADITLAQAREYDAGIAFAEEFKGERIPTLCEVLDLIKSAPEVSLKFDNVWESFGEMKTAFLRTLAESRLTNIGLTCAKVENIALAAELVPGCELHYDGGDLTDERLTEVKRAADGHKLTIWVCYDNAHTKWFKGTKADAEVCKRIKTYGSMGLWLLTEQTELENAERYGADVVETDGSLRP